METQPAQPLDACMAELLTLAAIADALALAASSGRDLAGGGALLARELADRLSRVHDAIERATL